MYDFNLLPQLHQKQSKRWIILRHIGNGFLLMNIVLVVSIGLLLLGNYSFQSIIDSAHEVTATSVIEDSDETVDIAKVNRSIKQLSEIQQQHQNYIQLLVQVTDVVPPDLHLTSLSVDYAENSITLSGTAEDRDALKNMQFTIENDERFELVVFPFDVFTQSSDIPFAIEMTFDPTAFQNQSL